jgi:hypothetical protein
MRRPLILTAQNGDTFTIFDDNHTLADILRWLCENKSEAEDLLTLLTLQLEEEQGS